MKVSIIVPVHNTEKYLRQCVGSLLSQTLDDIEVVLVENGSEDGSPDICRELSSEDPRVRYVTLEKGDLSTARNEGVRAAAGEYVGFVDSDDLVSPEMYGRRYEGYPGHDSAQHLPLFRTGDFPAHPVELPEERLRRLRRKVHLLSGGKQAGIPDEGKPDAVGVGAIIVRPEVAPAFLHNAAPVLVIVIHRPVYLDT